MSDERCLFWGGSRAQEKPLINENKSLASSVFENLQKCNPESVAQIEVDTGRQLTYGELKRRCLSAVQGLKSLGIVDNSVVSLVAYNSQESQVMAYASYMLGATVSPLDPTFPPETMAECLKLTKPKLMYVDGFDALKNVEAALGLSDSKPVIVFSEPGHRYISFHSMLKPLDPEFTPANVSHPKDHTAMIMFTSGTSGVPKGVVLCDLFATFLTPMNVLGEGETFLSTSALFWISGSLFSLSSLWKEMCLMIFRKLPEDEFIMKSIHRYRPSTCFAPPTTLRKLLSLDRSDYDLSSLKIVLTGGESLSSDDCIRIEKEIFHSHASLFQIYGMTECGNAANPAEKNKVGSCGIVRPGVCVKIEDLETKKCQGPGKEGEICIKHPYVSKRYLNAPSSLDKDGWLRSGDIGFFDRDGYLYVVDRVKDLIQYKSYQIAPVEIENALRAHPGVQEAAVFGILDYVDHGHPAAYVVAERNVTERDLHDFVAGKLPDFKQLRGGIRFIDSIPKSPTGKISRRLLRSKFMAEQLGN